MPVALSRRAALALMAGATLAACTSGADSGSSETPDPDAALRQRAAAQEQALLDLYDAAIAQQPGDASLAQIRDQHAAHLAALSASSPSASPSGAAPAADALVAAELEASRQRLQDCQSAQGEDLARLLTLIAASEAGHAAYLRQAST